jgi:hypothetical protein
VTNNTSRRNIVPIDTPTENLVWRRKQNPNNQKRKRKERKKFTKRRKGKKNGGT